MNEEHEYEIYLSDVLIQPNFWFYYSKYVSFQTVNLVYFKKLLSYLWVLEKLKNLRMCCSESDSNLYYLLFVLSGVKDVLSHTFTMRIKA